MDNRAAGATAAYLIGQWLGQEPGNVLITLSSGSFRGEEERELGFRSTMRAMNLDRSLVDITESDGLDETVRDLVLDALESDPEIRAVYSIGGGNLATLEAFDKLQRTCSVFIAHDLDKDNRFLLPKGRLSAVLHHDLKQDMRRACHLIMQAHHALPGAFWSVPSSIQVITPYNMPTLISHQS
jgi:LacI family transcriptional regulator